MKSSTVRLFGFFLITVVAVSATVAQEFRVRFTSTSSQEYEQASGSIQTKFQAGSQLLAMDAETIQTVLRERPGRFVLEFPAEIPLPSSINLETFQVFTPDARTVVRDEHGERCIPLSHDCWLICGDKEIVLGKVTTSRESVLAGHKKHKAPDNRGLCVVRTVWRCGSRFFLVGILHHIDVNSFSSISAGLPTTANWRFFKYFIAKS